MTFDTDLLFRLLGFVMFTGSILGLLAYVKIRGPVKTNFSRMANFTEAATAILVPGVLMMGLMLMLMGSPGGGIIGGPTP